MTRGASTHARDDAPEHNPDPHARRADTRARSWWAARGARVRYAAGALALLLAVPLHATRLDMSALLEGRWRADTGAGHCRLQREIAGVGTAVFERRAARAETFVVTLRERLPVGDVQATVEAPPWHPRFPSDAHLASVPRPADGRTLALAAAQVQALRAALGEGLAGVFSADATPGRGWPVPASGFTEAHARYARCLANLPPVRAIGERTARAVVARASAPRQKLRGRVLFDAQQATLDAAGRRALGALLAKSGAGARRVVVSGFSDDGGGFASNVALSRRRAEEVAAYLRAAGVPTARIGVRYFGDQYPVADSLTADGRAANRRATVEFVP